MSFMASASVMDGCTRQDFVRYFYPLRRDLSSDRFLARAKDWSVVFQRSGVPVLASRITSNQTES